MKKILIRLLAAGVILLILAVVAVALFLDKGLKRGIETVGPMLTKTEVKVGSVSLSLLSGAGKVKDFSVANPEGYSAGAASRWGPPAWP
jgi:autotransporter translocation and assembly factor TamB